MAYMVISNNVTKKPMKRIATSSSELSEWYISGAWPVLSLSLRLLTLDYSAKWPRAVARILASDSPWSLHTLWDSGSLFAYLTSLTGFVYAWPSYTVTVFASNATQLSAPMDSLQVSLLGSLTNLGALAVTPFCGYAIDTLGRKKAAILFGLPNVLAWSMLSLSNEVWLVLVAVTVAGVSAAGQAVSSVYISEIAHDSIRGGLTSLTVSGYFVGLLFSYVLGGHLEYHHVLWTHLVLSVLYMVLLTLLRESPVFLLQKGREEEAAKSVAFYRRCSVNSKEVEMEISKIKLQLNPRIEKILQGDNKELEAVDGLLPQNMAIANNCEEPKSSWQFLLQSESTKRALFVVLTLIALTTCMGSVVLQVYAEPLLKEAAPSIPSNLAAILLAVDFLVASLLCSVIVDKCGRKALCFYSAIGSGACSLLLGAQLLLQFAPHWVTALIVYAYTFVYTVGAATVPFILTAEVFLPEVRGLCNSIAMACMWISNFATLIVFNPLVDWLGLGYIFIGFAMVCVVCAVYCHFCLPETRGMSADAIQVLFLTSHKKQNTVSASLETQNGCVSKEAHAMRVEGYCSIAKV